MGPQVAGSDASGRGGRLERHGYRPRQRNARGSEETEAVASVDPPHAVGGGIRLPGLAAARNNVNGIAAARRKSARDTEDIARTDTRNDSGNDSRNDIRIDLRKNDTRNAAWNDPRDDPRKKDPTDTTRNDPRKNDPVKLRKRT